MGAKVTPAPVATALFAATAVMLLTACGHSELTATAATAPTSSSAGTEPQTPALRPDHKAPEDTPDDKSDDSAKHSVDLTPEERTRLGITTAPAQSLTFSAGEVGYGVVLSHDSIAQAVADLQTATGAEHVSHTALTRARQLASGPGALGLDTVETLEKQSSADLAALSLARHKLTAMLGEQLPWHTVEPGGELDTLASGRAKLVRLTFPSGAWTAATPKSLRLMPMDGSSATPIGTAAPVWSAPQDSGMPGRSFFALIKSADLPEGSRLQASEFRDTGTAGVLIPAAAVVISNGQYWCYLERKAGTFTRVAVDLEHPLGAGYFVSAGVKDGEPIVVTAAGLLLARETNASPEAGD